MCLRRLRLPVCVTPVPKGSAFLSFLPQVQGTVYATEVTVQRRGFCGGTDITGDVQ